MFGRSGNRRPSRLLAVGLAGWMLGAAAAVSAAGLDRRGEPAPPGDGLWVVDVEPDAAAAVRRQLAAAGSSIVIHLAADRWLVAGERPPVDRAPGVVAARSWRPAEGVDPLLGSSKAGGGGELMAVVVLAPGRPFAPVVERLEATGARVSWTARPADGLPQIGVRIPGDRVAEVAARLRTTPGLVRAEPQAPVRLLNSSSVWRCQSGRSGSTPVFDHGLHGEGQVIGIMDTGLDVDDCRFDDPAVGLPAVNDADGVEVDQAHRKVLAVDFHWAADRPPGSESWDNHGHGTHVAGSAAGDEGGNGTYDGVDGMAPAARLVIQDGGALFDECADLPGLGCPVKPLGPVLEQARTQGARLHSNSWGDEEEILPYGRYTERTADVDRFVWQHKDTLVLFAAGNSGPATGTVISPATGKNVVAVGATLHGDFEPPCVVDFSSRGPTLDGRIKPDVLAPGMWVVSAASNRVVPSASCGNAQSSGTSMATPTVAGLAALVRQYFTDGFYPTGLADPADAFEPTAALVKAVLIASAVDLSRMGCPHRPIPSPEQGWGLVRLDTALAFAGDGHRLLVDDHRDGFAGPADEPVRLRVAVTEPGALKVVLVWTDAPSSSLADVNLLNDLDLTVTGPGGELYGNVFADGASIAGGLHDRTNNVEVVLLPAAERGVWTVEVAPHAIPVPGQDFALVVTGPVRREPGPRSPSGRVAPAPRTP